MKANIMTNMTIESDKGKMESSYGRLKEEINNRLWFTFYTDSLDAFHNICDVEDIIVITFPCCKYKGKVDYISTARLQDNLYQIYFSLLPQNCIYSKYD